MGKNLLNDQQLAQSTIVANNRMNRKRKATGINSYEKDIKFNPIEFLENRIESAPIHWLDLCCGEGNALIETANYFQSKNKVPTLQLTGIDLVDYFGDATKFTETLKFKVANLSDWIPLQQYDLITIVHGLHYLGDKLGLIQKGVTALKKDGLFIGNLDLDNIKIEGKSDSKKWLKNYFKQENINYNSRTKILKIEGHKAFNNPFQYLGATDKAGPNYTGQAAVNSFYRFSSE